MPQLLFAFSKLATIDPSLPKPVQDFIKQQSATPHITQVDFPTAQEKIQQSATRTPETPPYPISSAIPELTNITPTTNVLTSLASIFAAKSGQIAVQNGEIMLLLSSDAKLSYLRPGVYNERDLKTYDKRSILNFGNQAVTPIKVANGDSGFSHVHVRSGQTVTVKSNIAGGQMVLPEGDYEIKGLVPGSEHITEFSDESHLTYSLTDTMQYVKSSRSPYHIFTTEQDNPVSNENGICLNPSTVRCVLPSVNFHDIMTFNNCRIGDHKFDIVLPFTIKITEPETTDAKFAFVDRSANTDSDANENSSKCTNPEPQQGDWRNMNAQASYDDSSETSPQTTKDSWIKKLGDYHKERILEALKTHLKRDLKKYLSTFDPEKKEEVETSLSMAALLDDYEDFLFDKELTIKIESLLAETGIKLTSIDCPTVLFNADSQAIFDQHLLSEKNIKIKKVKVNEAIQAAKLDGELQKELGTQEKTKAVAVATQQKEVDKANPESVRFARTLELAEVAVTYATQIAAVSETVAKRSENTDPTVAVGHALLMGVKDELDAVLKTTVAAKKEEPIIT